MTIPPELEARILRYYHVEKWRIGTIARQLRVHPETVARVLAQAGLPRIGPPRRRLKIDPWLPFIREMLAKFPTLTASRLHAMVWERGFRGGKSRFRAIIACHRPRPKAEAYLRLRTLPGEQSQCDRAHFDHIMIGRARRPLMAFVMVLSFSRQIFLRFFLDARIENFLRGHLGAFAAWNGIPRIVLYDNLRSAVLERHGDAIRFNPVLLEFAGHYRYEPRPVAVARGNEKGRVERTIRYVRDAFFAARAFADLDDLNAQADAWCRGQAADRRCPEDQTRSVAEVFAEEAPMLLKQPDNPYPVVERVAVKVGKTPYIRFDLNEYTVPHTHVRRTLTVLADPDRLRIVEGQTIVASHPRSYDKGEQIEDPAHLQALVDWKRQARRHRATDRLTQAAPASRTLLIRAAERGSNLGSITASVVQLLERYGASQLDAAIREALERDVPHPNAVRLALERRRDDLRQAPPVALTLPAHVRARAKALQLHGLLAHWPEAATAGWAKSLIEWEEEERARRSLERRLQGAHIGRFKPLCDFDWNWPTSIDRAAFEALMTLDFLKDATNALLVGPNDVGKSTLARNLAHEAVIHGHTVLFTSAGQLFGELASLDSDSALRRRLRHYVTPTLLLIDEVGYLSYSNRHADLMFELISRRYEQKSTVVTTNRAFAEWREVFPNAACVVSMVDRLMHNAEIVSIEGDSYRVKEAKERAERKAKQRRGGKS